MTIRTTWRARFLWEVLQIGNLIASPKQEETQEGEYSTVSLQYALWYRPLISFAFWLARPV